MNSSNSVNKKDISISADENGEPILSNKKDGVVCLAQPRESPSLLKRENVSQSQGKIFRAFEKRGFKSMDGFNRWLEKNSDTVARKYDEIKDAYLMCRRVVECCKTGG